MYQAVHFTLSPHTGEYIGMLSALLDMCDFDGIYEDEERISAYMKADISLDAILREIEPIMADAGCRLVSKIEDIPEQNWNRIWENSYEPVIIGSNCVIRAPFHPEYQNLKYQIIIEPKMSFGTGHHQTTKLMIEEIIKMDIEGKCILDMGCGTGILGILAAMMKASKIIAMDIDKQACENTVENARRNGISQISVRKGGVEKLSKESFDVVFANINQNILREQIRTYSAVLHPGGILMISGILLADEDQMLKFASAHGFRWLKSTELEGWIAMKFIRN